MWPFFIICRYSFLLLLSRFTKLASLGFFSFLITLLSSVPDKMTATRTQQHSTHKDKYFLWNIDPVRQSRCFCCCCWGNIAHYCSRSSLGWLARLANHGCYSLLFFACCCCLSSTESLNELFSWILDSRRIQGLFGNLLRFRITGHLVNSLL